MATVDKATKEAEVSSPFAVPIFRSIWTASVASNLGGTIQSVGAAWAMLSLSGSPQLVALVTVAMTSPVVFLAVPAGAIADNMNRRNVLLFAQGFMFLVSAILVAFSWAGWLTPATLLLFTFLIGCGMALNAPAWQASVGEMVPRSVLPAAVAYNSMQFNLARSVGPAVGGFIVQAAGATAAFLANAVSYIGLLIVLLRWKPDLPERTLPRESVRMAMTAGIRFVAMSPNISVVLVRTALFGSAAGAVPALMPVVTRDLLGGDAAIYGVVLGAFGVGGVAGAYLVTKARAHMSAEWIARTAWLGLAVSTLTTGLSQTIYLSVAALALSGGSWLFAMSTFNSTTQLASPRWVVARAVSLYQMCAFAGFAGGGWVFGWIAEHNGVTNALLAAAVWAGVGGLIGLRFRLPDVTEMNLDPLRNWREPDTAVRVEPRNGPVVVTIQYLIDPGDVSAFLGEMAERRRVRRRDGAYGWSLLRDLSDERMWIERYHVPTWSDYVRHNQRRTHADAANFDRILALHRGEEPPRVRRMLEQPLGGQAATAREMGNQLPAGV